MIRKLFYLKPLVVFAAILLHTFKSFAQDIIIFNNNDSIAASILTIDTSVIKYRKFNVADGPVYVADLVTVKKVKRADGKPVDLSSIGKDSLRVVKAEPAPAFKFVAVDKKRYMYNGTLVNESKMYKIMERDQDPALNLIIKKAKRSRNLRYITFVAIPLALGAVESFGSYLIHTNTDLLDGYGSASNSLRDIYIYSGAALGAGITGFCFKFRHDRLKKNAVDYYNAKH